MIDHIGIRVSDLERAIAFYTAALAPLGYTPIMRLEHVAGFGIAPKPDFWIHSDSAPTQPSHVAFHAKGRQWVREFYAAAIAAGGKDNGPPGLRPQYHEHYYGAFVLDPDGNNIEAVCHEPFLG